MVLSTSIKQTVDQNSASVEADLTFYFAAALFPWLHDCVIAWVFLTSTMQQEGVKCLFFLFLWQLLWKFFITPFWRSSHGILKLRIDFWSEQVSQSSLFLSYFDLLFDRILEEILLKSFSCLWIYENWRNFKNHLTLLKWQITFWHLWDLIKRCRNSCIKSNDWRTR